MAIVHSTECNML